MTNRILLISFFVFSSILFAQSFEEFINEVNALPQGDRQSKVDSFLQATSAFPLTEENRAHFIYSGTGNNLSVPGDFSGWNPANAPMTKIEGTNFWYRTEIFENEARLDYKFVYNGNTWILDPRNPFFAPGGFGNNSELRMPDYIPPIEIEYNPSIPHGTFEDTTFYSTNLNNSRQIRVYLPPGYYDSKIYYPTALVHDGLEYISFARANNVIDYLLSENLADPVIGIFVPPVNRTPEYISSDIEEFTSFIVDEVIPWIDRKYRTLTNPAFRAVMGSSAGGNISLWLGMNHPEIFGNIAAFSPYIDPEILSFFENSPRLELKIYMIHGSYDHIDVIHQSIDAFLPILDNKQYEYLNEEYPEGHSYGFWRAHLDDALILFSVPTTKIEQGGITPSSFNLYQNYPNPFNPTTNIKFSIPENGYVELAIYDILGNKVKILMSEYKSEGTFTIVFNAENFTSGIYFYKLEINKLIYTKKMLLIK